MFKNKIFLGAWVLGILCIACSDDENNVGNVESYPVEVSLSFAEKEQAFQYPGWNENRQIAAFRTDNRTLKKVILAQSGEETYVATSEDEIDESTGFAFLYPASASTVAESDTLAQALHFDSQDGTLEGLADYDIACGTFVYDTEDEDYTPTPVMTSVVSFGKFQFVDNGKPLERISQVIITSPMDSLHVDGNLDLVYGTMADKTKGSVTIRNSQGLSGEVYVAFLPTETSLHFTLSTLDGKSYEAEIPTAISLQAGETYISPSIACTALEPARVGDYYYDDATWSSLLDENKTCVGIVYALNDRNGEMDRNLEESAHGRVVALHDCAEQVTWCITDDDIAGIENHTLLQDTMYVGSLPYLNASPDSFFSDDVTEQLGRIRINVSTGQITDWYTEGVLSDFDGKNHAYHVMNTSGTFYAFSYCENYRKGLYGWYLPSAGELALLWTLYRSGVISSETHDGFEDFDRFGYWTSTEYDECEAWYINFFSGMITKNSKNSTYHSRPVIMF